MKEDANHPDKSGKGEKWIQLTSVANEIEFNMVAGLLKTANIPAVKQVNGIDGYLEVIIGVPLAGIIVKVPEERYEEALELINARVDEAELEAEAMEDGKS